MAFKSIGQRMGFVSIADAKRMAAAEGRRKGLKEGKKEGKKEGLKEGMEKGVQQEQANSKKKMNLFMNRIAKKMNIPKKELLALKP